uniref:Uncharacterized protein n=1 Tax=Trichobilharzia regenti TaxID=157069 RepID=A0AA85KDD9_TRIRE|nr:unnamed protein product [Trichobilharzia regenti]
MEFNRKSIRQIGYYTPTYSNSPNIIKRYKNDVSLFNINANTYRSELDGLNLPQFYMAENLKQYKYYKDGEQNKITNTTTVNNNENFTSSHMRINHTLDGKTQIIYETPSRTRQYWLNRRRLASANRTNDNITIITNSAVNQNINQLINKTNDPLKNKKHSISNVQFSLCGTTTIRAKTPATATPNNQCYYKTPDHKGELDHWNIEHKCMHKTKDMKLFELTENEFILSELDPRLNLNESGIILSDGKNYLNHSREYDEIPVYQPIEETNKVNVSPPTITSSTDHTWNKESSDQHNYPQHPHHHHHQQQQHKKPEYHETDSYHQIFKPFVVQFHLDLKYSTLVWRVHPYELEEL